MNASQVQRRADMILKVQAGEITASQAAAQLGMSRKTYYKWEKRALSAMLDGLVERETGRPTTPPDPEKEKLKTRIKELERELLVQTRRKELRERLTALGEKKE